MIDTHVHLGSLEDPELAIEEAVGAGVVGLITMGVDSADNRAGIELAENHAAVFAGVGHHPVNVEPPDWMQIEKLVGHPRVVALGEVGLDYAHLESPAELQRAWLHRFCDLAIDTQLPLSIHTREAESDVYEILRAHPGVRGVIHYFSLSWDWAVRFLDLGIHLSFSGLITRPSRGELRQVVGRCPENRLLLETDAPFGTPHGHRGEANRPAWIVDTWHAVAEIREMPTTALGDQEQSNARTLFSRIV
ncbi:MAG TPA: TatD family hydrolase [Candidatus Dormibacteraeota bacterium]|nr:TatD family hydrolase [Candidatus Dormibacteraeota bacterium]